MLIDANYLFIALETRFINYYSTIIPFATQMSSVILI
jgi:hypothetical protein